MNAIAPTHPAELHECSIRLAVGPAAVREARRQVRAAICSWDVAVDPDVAVLLTSELMTNAIRHEPGGAVRLVIARSCDQLRVEVHDTARAWPVLADPPSDAETGRGLMLVATLSAGWGVCRTFAGKAVYFVLAFPPDCGEGCRHGLEAPVRGDRTRGAASLSRSPADPRDAMPAPP
jgi:anti-sigma regulatory factor (Ser/Thr protein kinase)